MRSRGVLLFRSCSSGSPSLASTSALFFSNKALTEDLPSHGETTGNQTLRHHFLHLSIVSRVVCHTAQIRIHSSVESGNQPPVLLPPAGGAPIDPAVFGYIRVSQAEGESGLATQRRILNDHGLRDDRIFTDVASGKNMHRPSWRELRGMLKPGDTVVVPRIDRLARNLTEGLKTIEELHDQGINIHSLAEGLDTGDDSPTSRLMLHMLLSLAEWEREIIRDRIRAGVDRAAAEGRTGGRPPALSSEKVEAVRSFLDNGGSVSAAARTFGVSRPTVRPVKDGIYNGQHRNA